MPTRSRRTRSPRRSARRGLDTTSRPRDAEDRSTCHERKAGSPPPRLASLRELAGARRRRTFREAAARYLDEHRHKRSLERDRRALAALDPFIGSLPLERVHHDTLMPYVRSRLERRQSPGTINRELAVARRILNLAARLWRDASDRPWLAVAPLIPMQRHPHKRAPYPLSIGATTALFGAG